MDCLERFLAACTGGAVDRPPAWIMRQAGRYLPEYRAFREKHDFLEICHVPEHAAEVTLQPLRRFPLDAGIIFSDILVIPEALGFKVEFVHEAGPKITPQIASPADLDRIGSTDVGGKLAFVGEALKLTRRLAREELGREMPILGFAGAPFTLASYMIDPGKHSRPDALKILAWNEPKFYFDLMDRLSEAVISSLKMQIAAGATAVQLFDTWAGVWSPADYERYVLPQHKRIFAEIGDKVPRILFVKGAAGLTVETAKAGSEALALDWRVDPVRVRERVGADVTLQGNLDPLLLFAPAETIRGEVRRLHESLGGRRHIFNLGHGILPNTPIESVTAFLGAVGELA